MKQLRRPFAALLLLTCFLSTASAGTAPYTDGFISEAVYKTHEWGIFSGHPDGSFDPYTEMNRAELAKVLVLAAIEEEEVGTCAQETEWTFVDVAEEEWYAPYVYCAKAKGWVSGDDGKNTFRPGDPVLMAETFKMVVESQYGSPESSYAGRAWYDEYINFLEAYTIIEVKDLSYSGTLYAYTYQRINGDSGFIGFESSLNSKVTRASIAEMLYRMRVVFDQNDGEPYNLFFSLDELKTLDEVSYELGDTLSLSDPHFGFQFEDLPVSKLSVDPEDWRVYIQDPSGFEHGDYTSWWLLYPNDDTGPYSLGYDVFFHILILDPERDSYNPDFTNEKGQYLFWCAPSATINVEELLADPCVVDSDTYVDATYVHFQAN